MTIASSTNDPGGTPAATHAAAGWLALAAAPAFALMAGIAASGAAEAALCSGSPRPLPLDGMTAMYLLMSLFHLPPWLKLASRPSRYPASSKGE